MKIQYTKNDLQVKEYESLRAQVGWQPFSARQSLLALQNSLLVLCARDEAGKPVGMGRIVGDSATICYVQDLIVVPAYRRRHLGTALIEQLKDYVRSLTEGDETMRLCLMCAVGREAFYESCGFVARPTPNLGPGMICLLKTSR
ncbi:MAG: GNAT family N-acetyltransferase [Oscillospiraceae bacterium]|nr:GNAT family N-acetyltransferase [Oscillospiraceae bacterium]MDD3260842.1 GNAT family N-acetyltransferase [Oscillospiraceae bacterium]